MAAIKPIGNNPIISVMDRVWKRNRFYVEKLNEGFYRGAEPDAKQIRELSKMGIKTILNLKSLTKAELANYAQIAEANGMRYINIPLNPFYIKKSYPHIMEVLKAGSKENPTYIHCTFGKDRTGFVSALVNYFQNGVPMKEAIEDMTAHGCTSPIFSNLKRFLRKIAKQPAKPLDVKA